MPKEVEVFRVPPEGDGPPVVETATMYLRDSLETCQRWPGEWFHTYEAAERAARARGGR